MSILRGLAIPIGAIAAILLFLLAGSASTNPVLFPLAVGLMLAWRVAGYDGVDRYVLPMFGTPWRPGSLVSRGASPAGSPSG
jgi:thiosulfate dehydrogenase [quinone] large subunit